MKNVMIGAQVSRIFFLLIIQLFLLFSIFSFFIYKVLMKDRCKLFCRVAGTTAYYQLKDRVIDGTPCGTDTYDICVQGLCRVNLSAVSMATDELRSTQVPISAAVS